MIFYFLFPEVCFVMLLLRETFDEKRRVLMRREEEDDKDYEGETKENLDIREGEQRSLFA